MYIQDLPQGITRVIIVYCEAADSFIGKLDNESLISFEFRALKKVHLGDQVVIIKSESHCTFFHGNRIGRLPHPRASP